MAMKPIFHIHVPKTAGMAIVKTLGYNRNYIHLGHQFPSTQLENGNHSRLVWEMAIKFTVIRDPLNRFYSLYNYMQDRMNSKPKDLEDFFYNYQDRVFNYAAPQARWLTEGVTHILNFENLHEDWEKFCEEVGIMYRPLPKQNVGKGLRSYHHFYNDRLLSAVMDFYREDYELFPHYLKEINHA